jgi:lysophospholipase L1-like esterase
MNTSVRRVFLATIISFCGFASAAHAAENWAATWTAAQQGAFAAPTAPAGLSAPGEFQGSVYFPQPDTIRFALPGGSANGQSFRMVLRPDVWSDTVRVRFSNVWGKEPLVIGSASIGLQEYAGAVAKGTASPITFGGQAGVTIAAGERVFSDPVKLGFVSDATRGVLAGRNLAVSFAIEGTATALSYHDSAYQTSYISPPGSGDHAADDDGAAYPFTTTSWFIIDAVDAAMPDAIPVIVTVGDSITDGTLSTNNVDDRWPDVLAYRMHAAYGDKVSVVNEAINANALISPMVGEAALKRLDRDVLGVSGVKTVVLLEGINDLGAIGSTPEDVIAGMKEFVQRLHDKGIRVVGGTLTPSLLAPEKYPLSTLGTKYAAGYSGADAGRKVVNDFVRTSHVFDAVVDFEAAIIDPATGGIKDEYAPNSMGGPGDHLHPNHGGYLAMGEAIDLKSLLPP